MAEAQASPVFNEHATTAPATPAVQAQTDFEKGLATVFSPATAQKVLEVFRKLQIPPPETEAQFLRGQDGLLFFSNTLGLIFRVEKQDGKGYEGACRANDSAWMLQPLGAVAAGAAMVEILPGIDFERSNAESRKLYWKLWGDGYQYWDERLDNAGRLPFKTPAFPDGVTVVLDRLSVAKLSGATAPLGRALEILKGADNRYQYRSPIPAALPAPGELEAEFRQMMRELLARPPEKFDNKYDREGYEIFMSIHDTIWPEGKESPDYGKGEQVRLPLLRAMNALTQERVDNGVKSRAALGADDPQEILYGPLRRAFEAAWPAGADAPDAAAMTGFWNEVRAFRQAGKLVLGWDEITEDDGTKFTKAPKAARAYETLTTRAEKPSAAAPAP